MDQSTPASRMIEVAQKIVESVVANLPGMQGLMLKPLITNYMESLITSISDSKALEVCGTIEGFMDYVAHGKSVEEGVEVG